jgi:hypothetical protein
MDQKLPIEITNGPDSERRMRERRKDIAQFRFISRVLGMRRAFGSDTALSLMRRTGLTDEQAQQILAFNGERRLRRRRY